METRQAATFSSLINDQSYRVFERASVPQKKKKEKRRQNPFLLLVMSHGDGDL